jgi:hypothetical protein
MRLPTRFIPFLHRRSRGCGWASCAWPSRVGLRGRRAEAALADSKFLEFRLDSLAKPAAALPRVKEFLAGTAT